MAEAVSALASVLAAGGRDGADGARALRLIEMRGLQLVQLGVFAGCERDFAAAVESFLGVALPSAGGQPAEVSHPAQGWVRVYRTAADQYWVCSRNRGLAAALAATIAPDVGTVTALSCGRVRLGVEGPQARAVLETLVPIDLHPEVFRVGDCAQTGVHHLAVLLERTGGERFELVALRTFALTLWELLADAALRYGYDIEVEGQ
jgi:sarcosine oxidase subunit gamma